MNNQQLASRLTNLGYQRSALSHNKSYFQQTIFLDRDGEKSHNYTVTIGVQINGKSRGEIILSPNASETEAFAIVQADESLKNRLGDEAPKKIIYIPGRIINIII